MSEAKQLAPERYYHTYQRFMMLGLLCVVGLVGYTLMDLFSRPASESSSLGGWIIIGVYFMAIVAVQFVTLRGFRWRLSGPQVQRIFRDEWVLENRNRAKQIAFWTMLLAQVPLMHVMAKLPPERSAEAMGTLTLLLGLGVFFASYLYFSRRDDG